MSLRLGNQLFRGINEWSFENQAHKETSAFVNSLDKFRNTEEEEVNETSQCHQ